MSDNSTKNNLSRQQKTGFVLLLVFALLTVGLTFFQLRNTIYGPFVVRVSKEELQAKESMQFDETVRLQQIDTDRDGINDYEELNFYETSPYLPDTDSDGVEDKVEIDQGTDPLCPEGTVCTESEFIANASSSIDLTFGSEVETPAQILVKSQFEGNSSSTPNLTQLFEDPKALREILLSTGQISAEDLNKISDDALIQYAKKIAQNEFNVSINSSTSQ